MGRILYNAAMTVFLVLAIPCMAIVLFLWSAHVGHDKVIVTYLIELVVLTAWFLISKESKIVWKPLTLDNNGRINLVLCMAIIGPLGPQIYQWVGPASFVVAILVIVLGLINIANDKTDLTPRPLLNNTDD